MWKSNEKPETFLLISLKVKSLFSAHPLRKKGSNGTTASSLYMSYNWVVRTVWDCITPQILHTVSKSCIDIVIVTSEGSCVSRRGKIHNDMLICQCGWLLLAVEEIHFPQLLLAVIIKTQFCCMVRMCVHPLVHAQEKQNKIFALWNEWMSFFGCLCATNWTALTQAHCYY